VVRRLLIALALCALGAAAPPARTHLAGATSRYLVEHADNAVDWYPWSEKAFAKAKAEDKPVFLSIGFASCHWCHVMERESFQDPAIAEFINANYVAILVDRNERPDVDATYTAFVATMNNGNAGWPANLVLTPELSPIAGSSYLSADALRAALGDIAQKWRGDRASLLQNGAAILAAARANAQESSPLAAVEPRVGQALFAKLRDWNDRENGGFGSGPKFPQPFYVDFLLRRWQAGDDLSREMVVPALDALYRGAIHDQIAGGFHRYTTDAAWRKPHFEKMLPDQALLAIVYLEAWQLLGRDEYLRVARRTLDYAMRRLRLKTGAFAAGEDADSFAPVNGPAELEGAHYLWSREELRFLKKEDAELIAYFLGIGPTRAVPAVAHSEAETRKQFGLSKEAFEQRLDTVLEPMALVQSHRPSPLLDDTVIASWNALMVSALARAGAALGDDHYRYAASETMRAVETRLYDAKTKTWSHARGVPALTADYALLIQAYLDLFDSTSNVQWLARAIDLQEKQDALFWNGSTLRYDDGSALPAILRSAQLERDGDLPSASSVSAYNLLRIAAITDSKPARAKAEAIFRSFAARMQNAPGDLPFMISVFNASTKPAREVVIVGDVSRDDTRAMIRAAQRQFVPLGAVFVVPNERTRAELVKYAPFIAEMKPVDEKLPTAYVCENYSCKSPTTDVAKLEGMLTP